MVSKQNTFQMVETTVIYNINSALFSPMMIIVSGMSLSFYHSRPALFDLHFHSSQRSMSANTECSWIIIG